MSVALLLAASALGAAWLYVRSRRYEQLDDAEWVASKQAYWPRAWLRPTRIREAFASPVQEPRGFFSRRGSGYCRHA